MASSIPYYGISAPFQLLLPCFRNKEIILPDLTHRNITDVNEVLHSSKISKSNSLM